ncbi:hypothetical protein GCM10029964_086280 [Kibdelosporangium lantanae]
MDMKTSFLEAALIVSGRRRRRLGPKTLRTTDDGRLLSTTVDPSGGCGGGDDGEALKPEEVVMKRWSDVLAVKRRLTGLRGLRRTRKQANDKGMYLASLSRTVPAHPDLLTPDMRVVLVEDLLWELT